jgi:hypothetical protein
MTSREGPPENEPTMNKDFVGHSSYGDCEGNEAGSLIVTIPLLVFRDAFR